MPRLDFKTAVFSHIPRCLQAISPSLFAILFCLTLSNLGSAQTFLVPIENSCGARKAYGVVFKLLAVYASHVFTIKLPPGVPIWAAPGHYVMAGLLPSSSAGIALLDLENRKSGFHLLRSREDAVDYEHYKNMQKAINAGAVCFRIEKNRVLSGARVHPQYNVRAKPLRAGEVFIEVPRGAPAHAFTPIMIQGSSQFMKALLGAIQLGFATVQLVSAANPRVAAYGCGAFIYTIIPYAYGSAINIIAALCTDSYGEITEMELASDTTADLQTSGGGGEVDFTAHDEGGHELQVLQRDRSNQSNNDGVDEPLVATTISWKDDTGSIWLLAVFLSLSVYLAIVGGITRFHAGISTHSQRGWFISWAIIGTVCGPVFGEISPTLYDEGDRTVKIRVPVDSGESQEECEHPKGNTDLFVGMSVMSCVLGVATIGGVVAMIQQYLHLFNC